MYIYTYTQMHTYVDIYIYSLRSFAEAMGSVHLHVQMQYTAAIKKTTMTETNKHAHRDTIISAFGHVSVCKTTYISMVLYWLMCTH